MEKEADAQAAMLAALIPEYVYGYENDELQSVVAQLLTDKNLKIATAESCTGGYLSHMITSLAGSSAYFEGGVISYSYDLKEHLLGVDHNTLLEHGAVSEATIKQMAQGARERLGVDIALATSGIAGPGGGMPGKPVGTVWIALCSKEHIITKKLQLGGSRAQNIQLSATILLNLLRKYLLGLPMENTW